jgi:hypothetical protein
MPVMLDFGIQRFRHHANWKSATLENCPAPVWQPSSTIGGVNEFVPLAVARDELKRINGTLESSQLLISAKGKAGSERLH